MTCQNVFCINFSETYRKSRVLNIILRKNIVDSHQSLFHLQINHRVETLNNWVLLWIESDFLWVIASTKFFLMWLCLRHNRTYMFILFSNSKLFLNYTIIMSSYSMRCISRRQSILWGFIITMILTSIYHVWRINIYQYVTLSFVSILYIFLTNEFILRLLFYYQNELQKYFMQKKIHMFIFF